MLHECGIVFVFLFSFLSLFDSANNAEYRWVVFNLLHKCTSLERITENPNGKSETILRTTVKFLSEKKIKLAAAKSHSCNAAHLRPIIHKEEKMPQSIQQEELNVDCNFPFKRVSSRRKLRER